MEAVPGERAGASLSGEIAMAGNVEETTDGKFDIDVIQSKTPVLVDFWAPWCGPCKSIAPVLEDLAKEYEGRIRIMKLNVDDNPKTPSSYNVRGIPNLVFFKGGQVVEQIVGAVPRDQLVAAITKVV
jgi:thioredoxin 1